MTKDFSFDWKNNNHVSIKGVVNEHSDFKFLVDRKSEMLFLDLKEIIRINSSGVRNWVFALNQLRDVELHYTNCSFAVVDQLSMIPEFLTKKCCVESFDARYVCKNCNTSYTVTLIVGHDIQPGLDKYLDGPTASCPTCKEVMEFDHNPDSYLFFLTKLPKIKSE